MEFGDATFSVNGRLLDGHTTGNVSKLLSFYAREHASVSNGLYSTVKLISM